MKLRRKTSLGPVCAGRPSWCEHREKGSVYGEWRSNHTCESKVRTPAKASPGSKTLRYATMLLSQLHSQLSIRILGLLRANDGVTEGKG